MVHFLTGRNDIEPADLVGILCVEEERVVARDNTVSWHGYVCNCPKAGCATTTSKPG